MIYGTAEALGYPVRALKAWIGLYADRCSSKYHHAGFARLLDRSNVNGVRDQIIADKTQLAELTPSHMQLFIPYIRAALEDYRDSLFKVFTKKECVLTENGITMAKLGKK
jgi:hypothetical protein